MPEISPNEMGGNMRLGSRMTRLKEGSIAYHLYDEQKEIYERHRHRYEVNPELVEQMEAKGLQFSGQDDMGVRMEVIELTNHRYFVGTQFHPEFKSRPFRPSPPFVGLIRASANLPVVETEPSHSLNASLDITETLANLSLSPQKSSNSSFASPAVNADVHEHLHATNQPTPSSARTETDSEVEESTEEAEKLDSIIDAMVLDRGRSPSSEVSEDDVSDSSNGLANGVAKRLKPGSKTISAA